MAYVKVKPIKVTVKKALKYAMNDEKVKIEKEQKEQDKDKDITNELNYIMNQNKTTYKDELDQDIKQTVDYNAEDNMKEIVLSSGINCVADPEIAYFQFELVYQKYPEKLDWGKQEGKKAAIKAHHFIQSFKPGEVEPQKAHEMGLELCKKAFGDRFQIIVSTHLDKEHVHNHIIVNAINLDGGKYHDNGVTLDRVRTISDELCQDNNLSIINKEANKSKPKNNFHYKEWQARKQGTSWKQKIQIDIDKLVIKVSSLEQLLAELKKQGYEIKDDRKYITVKPPGKDRFVRTKTLGEEYTEEALIRRINEKDKELPVSETVRDRKSYRGIQQQYNNTLTHLGIMIVRGEKNDYRRYDPKKPYSVQNDYDVNVLANQLSYLTKQNIQSELDLKAKFEEVKTHFIDTRKDVKKLNNMLNTLKSIQEQVDTYNQLKDKPNKTEADLIMLKSCDATFKTYNIKTGEDMRKYAAAYRKANKDIDSLNTQMKAAEDQYKAIEDIINTYEKINTNTYLEHFKNKEQQHTKEQEKQQKQNKDRDR